jgi:hypothetical protein
MYQTEFKEAKDAKKIIKGTRKNKGVIRKFHPKKRIICTEVKLAK